jgi:dTDP-4-amino-4,6-dideoxygalactose transaminase
MIPLLDLVAQYNSIKPEIDAAILDVLNKGAYILGGHEKDFEGEIASYLGVKHAVGLASGTDALIIALRAVEAGPGDEVIVPAYSFFATAGAVLTVGATPVFVDVTPGTYLIDVNKIESRITAKTKAIIPVHLYGQPADMDEIMAIASKYHLAVLEDNAQGFGSEYKGKKSGTIGTIGCISFFPSKNLGAYGDAGMVVTNDDALAEKMRMLRVHGWKKKYFPEMLGYNSRLDEIQAAILQVKLKHIDTWNNRRHELAQIYTRELSKSGIETPVELPGRKHVYHLYMIGFKNRDEIQKGLSDAGVSTALYYPQPLHLAKPCEKLGYKPGDMPISEKASTNLLAIPIYPEMSADQQAQIIDTLKRLASK